MNVTDVQDFFKRKINNVGLNEGDEDMLRSKKVRRVDQSLCSIVICRD